MTRVEILRLIEIEDARVENADRNIAALINQRGKSLEKITYYQELLKSLPNQEAGV